MLILLIVNVQFKAKIPEIYTNCDPHRTFVSFKVRYRPVSGTQR